VVPVLIGKRRVEKILLPPSPPSKLIPQSFLEEASFEKEL
jgi:hypothetical protein